MRTGAFVAAILTIGTVRAQISGPVAAFIFDSPEHSIRPIIGLIGSATVGAPVVRNLEFASTPPGQNYAIAVRRGAVLFISELGSATTAISALAGAAGVPDGVSWSADGLVAILYSRHSNWIQVFTGFPNAIRSGSPISTPGSLLAVATDTRGEHIALCVGGSQAGIYRVTDGQVSGPLFQSDTPDGLTGLTFSPDGNTLYALDRGTNQIFEFDLTGSALQKWPAAVNDAVAIRAAIDSSGMSVLYLAGGASQVLVALDKITHQPLATVSLSFTPTIIEPLGTNGFLLTPRSDLNATLWTFINSPQPIIYFVPSGASERPRPEGPR
jgi:sugar lactone lactonase YvrE